MHNTQDRGNKNINTIIDSISKARLQNDSLVIDKIVIDYVEPWIETFVSVSCDGFYSSFPTPDKIVFNRGSKELSIIDSLYGKFTDNPDPLNSIDVRVHIDNYSHEVKKSTICVDYFGHFYFMSDGKFKSNKPLKDFIFNKMFAAGFKELN